MSDLISRQAAIDAMELLIKDLRKDAVDVMNFGHNYNHGVADAIATLKHLPSAERRGRWIKKYRGNFLCSECGAWFRTTDEYGNIIDGEMRAKYCEVCGAKMDESEK